MPDSATTAPASPLGEPTPLPPAIEARLDEYRDVLMRHSYVVDGSDRMSYAESCTRVVESRAALSTEIGKLVEDAARLDWLDDVTHQFANPEFQMYGNDPTYWLFEGKRRDGHKGADVREAIDNARAEIAARSTPRPPSR